ncbi:MAG: glycosyltransferase family 4 protein [Armatimonadota bacterium]
MRIILAHKYFFRGGGTATYLFALREQLHALGHETIPFTVAFERTEVDEYSEFYVSPPAGASQDHLKDITMTPWTALKLLARSTWSVEAYYKARALVEATEPDVAYVHNLYTYMSPSPIAAFKDMGVPVVMRVSDYNMVCPGLKVLREGKPCFDCIGYGPMRALRHRCHKQSLTATAARVAGMALHESMRVYDLVDHFITPSRFMADVLFEAGYGRSRITHIPSFYPAAPATRTGEAKDPYILYFGRIAPEKGLEDLLQAHAQMTDPPRLVLAGADSLDYARSLRDLAARLRPQLVEFAGFQEPNALSDLIAGSLFTVVPSVWPDNCPMSILESFAHGKPVLAARVGGIPEQVTDDCGLLFEPGDTGGLASAMRQLSEDCALRERLGDGARRRLREVYSPDAHVRSLVACLSKLVPNTEVEQRPAAEAPCRAAK